MDELNPHGVQHQNFPSDQVEDPLWYANRIEHVQPGDKRYIAFKCRIDTDIPNIKTNDYPTYVVMAYRSNDRYIWWGTGTICLPKGLHRHEIKRIVRDMIHMDALVKGYEVEEIIWA